MERQREWGTQTEKLRPVPKNVGDFPKNVGDFPKNVGDFLKNVGDFPKNVADFPKNVGDFPKNVGDFQHLEIVSRFLLENMAALLEILTTCPRTSRGSLLASLALLEIASARLAMSWSMQERGFLDTQ